MHGTWLETTSKQVELRLLSSKSLLSTLICKICTIFNLFLSISNILLSIMIILTQLGHLFRITTQLKTIELSQRLMTMEILAEFKLWSPISNIIMESTQLLQILKKLKNIIKTKKTFKNLLIKPQKKYTFNITKKEIYMMDI